MFPEAVDLFKIPDVDEPFWKGLIIRPALETIFN